MRNLCLLSFFAFAAPFFINIPTPAVATTSLQCDPVHSFVWFKISHLGASNVYGRFADLSGTIEVDDASKEVTAVAFDLKADTVDTGHAKRDAHLKTADFLNVQECPVVAFKSTKVKPGGKNTVEAEGELTLHGMTKPLTIRVTKIGTGKAPDGTEVHGFESTFMIKRSDFGMNQMLGMVGDEVTMTVAVEASKK